MGPLSRGYGIYIAPGTTPQEWGGDFTYMKSITPPPGVNARIKCPLRTVHFYPVSYEFWSISLIWGIFISQNEIKSPPFASRGVGGAIYHRCIIGIVGAQYYEFCGNGRPLVHACNAVIYLGRKQGISPLTGFLKISYYYTNAPINSNHPVPSKSGDLSVSWPSSPTPEGVGLLYTPSIHSVFTY